MRESACVRYSLSLFSRYCRFHCEVIFWRRENKLLICWWGCLVDCKNFFEEQIWNLNFLGKVGWENSFFKRVLKTCFHPIQYQSIPKIPKIQSKQAIQITRKTNSHFPPLFIRLFSLLFRCSFLLKHKTIFVNEKPIRWGKFQSTLRIHGERMQNWKIRVFLEKILW